MKATRSKDGELRFTVTVKHRVSRIDIVNAVRIHIETTGEPMPCGRVDIMDVVRRTISHEGDSMWTTAGDMPELTAEQLATIDKAFPELVLNFEGDR